jgi:nitrogen fixation protein NifB
MHVAVAPACNIQCHYCNRKYDCANESRPGVVSELLTPDQAVRKVTAVAANIPQMTVLGIAGPGDPLANRERTLSTFRELTEKAPDIKLCVSTNGLTLPDVVDELCEHNIDHVTITVNCVDPEVGAKIYSWIFWKNRRIKGVKGAKILIEQQQKGLEMLVERGVLVKVNSVMIPGVNDEHLKEVSRIVKAKGAFLHNVMPLIAEAEHGTFYGLMGQRGPTHDELRALQGECDARPFHRPAQGGSLLFRRRYLRGCGDGAAEDHPRPGGLRGGALREDWVRALGHAGGCGHCAQWGAPDGTHRGGRGGCLS